MARSSARPTESCSAAARRRREVARLVGVVVVGGEEHAADDGDAERAAGLAGGVVDRGADAGPARRQRAHDRFGGRRRGEPESDAEEEPHRAPADERRHDHVGRVQQHRRRGDEQTPGPPPAWCPTAARTAGRSATTTIIPMATGMASSPGLERRVPEHELEVLDEQEHRAVERERREREHARRGREPRVPNTRTSIIGSGVCISHSANTPSEHEPDAKNDDARLREPSNPCRAPG